ncbi:guanylate kinase [bacterium]|nr:guanylate kinase [bacterium]
MPGRLFVISSPSGGGKNSIISRVMRETPDLVYSVSVTTRPPRNGEVHGNHYFFVTRDEFREHIENGAFLEWAEVHGEYYGTLRSQVEGQIAAGKRVILDIDVQGARSVKGNMPAAVTIFILPPSLEELRARLIKRGTETPDLIEKRLTIAGKEMEAASGYDYIVINNILDNAVRDVKTILDVH